MDSLIALYGINIRFKEWYHRNFFHFLDVAVVNSWFLYRRDFELSKISRKVQLSLLQFKAEIAACLCHQEKTEIRKRGRPSLSQAQLNIEVKKKSNATPVPVQEIRRDETGHWPTFTEKRGRYKNQIVSVFL